MNETVRLGRNYGASAYGQILSQILTLVISLVIARVLGVEQYGIFVFGFAFPSWFLLLASFGLNQVLTIEVAADKEKANSYLTTISAIRLVLVPLSIGLLWVFLSILLSDPFARTIALILGIANILQTFAGTFTSLFRAYERLGYMALVGVVERLFTTLVVLGLLFTGFGLVEISFAFVLGSAVMLVTSLTITKAKFPWFAGGTDWTIVKRILRLALPFALAAAVATFTNTTGIVLLTLLQNPQATGQFNAALTIQFALLSFVVMYQTVFLPTMSRIHRENPERLAPILYRTQRLFFMVGWPAALGGWFYAEEIMTLFYGDAFGASATAFEVIIFNLAIATAFLGNSTALAASGRQPVNLAIGVVRTATTIGLSLVLIPQWGFVGAAYAFVGAAALRAVLSLAAVRRYVARVDLWNTLSRPALAGSLMVIFFILVPGLPLWLGIPVGGGLYFLLLYAIGGITREDWALVKEALRGALFR